MKHISSVETVGYTSAQHVVYTLIGLLTFGVIIFTMKSETEFLTRTKQNWLQLVLSIISIFSMLLLTLTLLGHWFIPHVYTFLNLIILGPLLLMLAPVILLLRSRSFKELQKRRLEEQKRLISEVEEILDEKKRESIQKGKIDRGEI